MTREQSLAVTGQITVQDPKFFSVLTIPGSYLDPQLRATVNGVARDFNGIAQADLFEVTDAEGHLMAAVGRDALHQSAARRQLHRRRLWQRDPDQRHRRRRQLPGKSHRA